MFISNDVHWVEEIIVEKSSKLVTEGLEFWVKHITFKDENGNMFKVTAYAENEENLLIKTKEQS